MIGGILWTLDAIRDAVSLVVTVALEIAREAGGWARPGATPPGPDEPSLRPVGDHVETPAVPSPNGRPDDFAVAFAQLLERSREPKPEPGVHPAFETILSQMTPDEARILRLFAAGSEQPLIHVKAIPRYGFGPTLVLENFTLLGEQAGCHHSELVAAYVDNLCRLGLVRIHRERGEDRGAHELLEIHPQVKAACQSVRDAGQRIRFDRRVLRLTSLGRRFCDLAGVRS